MKQFVKFGIVGMLTNMIGYSTYLLVTWLGVEPKITMSGIYFVAATFGYYGHRQWSFIHSGSIFSSSVRYIIAHMLGYFLNYLFLYYFSDRLGYPHQFVQAVSICVLVLFFFAMYRFFVFPKNMKSNFTKQNI